jgi:hypothetical protein
VATISSLVDRVRLELGDQGKSFVTQFVADGTTNRFRLNYSPLDATTVYVYQDGVDVTSTSYVEESTGVLVVDGLPADGIEFRVVGTYFRYFTAADLTSIVETALGQHSSGHTDSVGRALTAANLPFVEEYPVVIYATTLALYTLATDASFDIDIQAPDGVSIPRSERYRQLMDMVAARQSQYRELCVLLGLGMYKVEVLTLRRQSKATGRLVPVYKPQEVDDRSYPQRVHTDLPTYGDKPAAWPTEGGELTAYQGRAFTADIAFTGDYFGLTFVAKLLNQRGSVLNVQNFTLAVVDNDAKDITTVARVSGQAFATITSPTHGFTAGDSIQIIGINTELDTTWTVATVVNANTFTVATTATTLLNLEEQLGVVAPTGVKSYTATMSLTSDQTLRLANRTYWSIQLVDPDNTDPNSGSILPVEIKGGNFFTQRVSDVVL